ncbi:DegT/DnrJ/EryC1/StrS family aminotransferase [Lysinibacillus fusiformis]|uniref:DegT/DnrJ/EryC1/StrS family aminotransferase n=1 Tax=Lysinibacillus fusiformis TaxID=28031 RepID=UPI003CFD1012
MIKYPLATETWDEEELEAMKRVISSNRFSMGPEVENFEKGFANYFGSKYAIMVNSGSSANLLCIAALFFHSKYKLKKGDEVIVPAVSWSTTYAPLQQYGLKVKFVDIDLKTLNIDIKKLKEAVTEKTKLIFTVNLLGNSNDFDAIQEIIKGKNIILLEDNCESMGAKYKGKFLGTFGVMGTFSMFYSHHISTMEGGMIVTDDLELADILKSLRAHGWTRNISNESELHNKNEDTFYEMFNFILPGYNVRPLELEGAIGSVQLKKLENIVENRRENAKYFLGTFGELKSILIQKEIGESSYFGFSIIVKETSKFSREDLLRVFRKNNIECRPIVAGNFTRNSVIKYFDYEIHDTLKNADFLHENGLFIGNHHYDCKDKLKQIYKIIQELD